MNKDITTGRLRRTWVELELRRAEIMREVWAIETKQDFIKKKLLNYGEFERALQELADLDPDCDSNCCDRMDSNPVM